MNEKTEPVYLGSLDVGVYFEHEGTKYRTIDHAPSSSPYQGARQCLNMTTLKAETINCWKKVVKAEKD